MQTEELWFAMQTALPREQNGQAMYHGRADLYYLRYFRGLFSFHQSNCNDVFIAHIVGAMHRLRYLCEEVSV